MDAGHRPAILLVLALGACTSPAGARRPDTPLPTPGPARALEAADLDVVVAVHARIAAARAEGDRQSRERGRARAMGEAVAVAAPIEPTDAPAVARALGHDPEHLAWVEGRVAAIVLEARRCREREAAARFRAAHLDGLRGAIERAPTEERPRLAAIVAAVEDGAARDRALAATPAGSEAEHALVARYAGALGLTLLPEPEVEASAVEPALEIEGGAPAGGAEDGAGTRGDPASPPR